MKLFFKPSLTLLFFASLFLNFSCSNDDDPVPQNEEELITTVRLEFTPKSGGNTVSAMYVDVDGDGGQAPVIGNIELLANTEYNIEVTLLDESKNPFINITDEVEEEGDEHQFFYVPSNGLNLYMAYEDADANGRPIGIKTSARTFAPSTGTLRVVLKHLPGQKSTSSTINTGETDVEVVFPVTIQ